MYSEKELIREFEQIASTLVPEKDWSLRIGAMQRVEGLVIGGMYDLLFLYINNKCDNSVVGCIQLNFLTLFIVPNQVQLIIRLSVDF